MVARGGPESSAAGPRTRRFRLRPALGILASLAFGAMLVRGLLIEPFDVEVRDLTLPCRGLARGPVRILLFSDVDFRGVGVRERAVREAGIRFRPDLVLVAGDLLDRRAEVDDPARVRESGEFFASIPASRRFLVPGEEESVAIERLREAWAPHGVEVLSGKGVRIDLRGERIELFGADLLSDAIPWPLGRDGDRRFVFSREGGRVAAHRLVHASEPAREWRELDATFAFEAVTPRAFLEFDVGWRPGPGAEGGTGWQICRDDSRKDFVVYAHWPGRKSVRGRRESGFVPPAGRWCRARVQWRQDEVGSRLRARFWQEGAVEPSSWSIDVVDTAPGSSRSGSVAFAGRLGVRRYADLRVTDPAGGTLLEERFDDPRRVAADWTSGSALQAWQLLEASAAGCRIVLAHHPDTALFLQDLVPPHVDAVLAGHTHGGQVRIPWFGAPYTATRLGRAFDRGLFRVGSVPLYITAGVGTSLVPIRLFDPPEVTRLTLVPEPSAR